MEFIRFLSEESSTQVTYILILSIIYALTTGLFGPMLVHAVGDIIAGEHYLIWLCLLPGSVAVQVLTYREAEFCTIRLAEAASENMMLRITDSLRRDELPEFERRDPSEIYLSITGARAISEGAVYSIAIFQNLLIMFVLWFYLFHLYKLAGLIFLLIFGWIVLIQELYQRIGRDIFQDTVRTEERLFDVFHHFLKGFKEIKVCERKNQDLFENYLMQLMKKIQELRYRVVFFRTEFMVAAIATFSIFMGIEVFFFRSSGVGVQLLIVTLYADQFFWPVIASLPKFHEGRAALARLRRFAAESRPESENDLYDPAKEQLLTFQTLKFEDIRYTYREPDGTSGFSVGPAALSLRAGDIVFLAGGNGSGKSTLVKILTGLYPHDSGSVRIDGNQINLKDHRYLFSAVFSDFHLFDALYGVDAPDEIQIQALLTKMQLRGKTGYADDKFTTQDLSAGQRRRMAMVIALLEDKPIYVFDEWAADQDPYSRRFFYEELLPSLKMQGKTVLAVTHDDGYYPVADQVVFMKDGMIVEAELHPGEKAKQGTSPSDVSDFPSGLFSGYEDSEGGTENEPRYVYPQSKEMSEPIIQFQTYKQSLLSLSWLAVIDAIITPLRIYILFSAAFLPSEANGIRLFFIFIIIILLDFVVARRFNHTFVRLLEKAISDARTGIIDRVRKISLASFEKIRAERIYTALTADLKVLADISFLMAISFKFSIRMVGLAGYFAFLAFPVFMTATLIIGGIGLFYVWNQFRIKNAIDRLRKRETAFFDAMRHLLEGFKELRLNNCKNDSFFHTCVSPLCSQLRSFRLTSARYLMTNKNIVFGTFTLLLGMLPLIFPFFSASSNTLLKCIGILFFVPTELLAITIPSVLLALTSVQRLRELKQTLETTDLDFPGGIPPEDREVFQDIYCRDLTFHYLTDENHPFSVGPINLTLQAGEILFITGGNGSGKSTFLKMITGLYAPDTGDIILNGQVTDIRRHRHLFSLIFSDYHLFDRLYGFPGADEIRVNKLITLMGLENKVTFADGKFSMTGLSSGQKKRLALVAAIMEDRPIYVFDEWAAEQDPHFRRYFYETLVPAFKSEGKTVIAVTHHDQYFHLADRVVKMDYGRITEIG